MIPATVRYYKGPSEAISISINDEGLCYSITSGFVLDKSEGITITIAITITITIITTITITITIHSILRLYIS